MGAEEELSSSIFEAVLSGRVDILRALVDAAGADVSINNITNVLDDYKARESRPIVTNNSGITLPAQHPSSDDTWWGTVLHHAVKRNDADMVRALLHAGASPSARDSLGRFVSWHNIEACYNMNHQAGPFHYRLFVAYYNCETYKP